MLVLLLQGVGVTSPAPVRGLRRRSAVGAAALAGGLAVGGATVAAGLQLEPVWLIALLAALAGVGGLRRD